MLRINLISKINRELIHKCVELGENDYFDNIVLLGDLFPPCVKLTDIYGVFDGNELISFFTVFKGFKAPSVVPLNNSPESEIFILSNLDQIVPKGFTLVSFTLKEKELTNYFEVKERSSEYCMITNRSKFRPINPAHTCNRVTKENYGRIDKFYRVIQTYPWNPIQLESNFYFFSEIDDKIIACGGTHFETPDAAHLRNIIVLPEFRGQSIGTTLVSTITSEILKEKFFVTLFVTKDNLPAIKLYKKLGFSRYKPVSIFSCNFD